MALRPVHWHEGMFLRPHHVQTAQRHATYLAGQSDQWNLHYSWGLRSIEIDRDALKASQFVIRFLKARLRDGTLVSVPEDGRLDAIDLKEHFRNEQQLSIYLAVPALQLGRANVSENAAADGARYRLESQPLEDENTGVNPQEIAVRVLNVRLLPSTQDHAGYEVLEVARLVRADRPEAQPELDRSFIPPVLACDAWPVLAEDILGHVYQRIVTKINTVAPRVISRGISFESAAQGHQRTLAQLRILNEASALFGTLIYAEGVHPLMAYLELCRLVGQLSIFSEARRPPALPRYDHDDLGGCFFAVRKQIDALIEFEEDPYEQEPFVGEGLRMGVVMKPQWLEGAYQMFIGVESDNLNTDQCVNLLTRAGLDMKVGSANRVDHIYRAGKQGLKFTPVGNPPGVLPAAGTGRLTYFQVDRNPADEWQYVRDTLTLAIRLNENRVAGSIDGQKRFTIITAGRPTELQFTLYVLRPAT